MESSNEPTANKEIFLEECSTYEEYVEKIKSLPEGEHLIKIYEFSGYNHGTNVGGGRREYTIPKEWQKKNGKSYAENGGTAYDSVYFAPDGKYEIPERESVCDNQYCHHPEKKTTTRIVVNGYLLLQQEEYNHLKSYYNNEKKNKIGEALFQVEREWRGLVRQYDKRDGRELNECWCCENTQSLIKKYAPIFFMPPQCVRIELKILVPGKQTEHVYVKKRDVLKVTKNNEGIAPLPEEIECGDSDRVEILFQEDEETFHNKKGKKSLIKEGKIYTFEWYEEKILPQREEDE